MLNECVLDSVVGGKNPRIPDVLIVMVTRKCNIDCSHCYVDKENKDEPSYVQVKEGIENFLALGGRSKEIGEPLLRFDLIKKLVESIKRRKGNPVKMSINTNGLLLNPKIVNFIKKIICL